jgi:hypothetical protein
LQEQERLLLVGLLQGLERAPLQRQEQALLHGLVQTQVRGLLRQQERRLLRCEGRVRFRAQVQHREQALWRVNKRGLARGPGMALEQGLLQRQERLLLPALLRHPLRVPERRPFRGQGLPLPSGGRESARTKSKANMIMRLAQQTAERSWNLSSLGQRSQRSCKLTRRRGTCRFSSDTGLRVLGTAEF